MTGDGTADVVYVADGSVTVWLNQSGNGFASPVTVRGTPRVASTTSVRLADFDGIGVSGLLWSGIGTAGSWAFLDLTGGVKPYLMTGIDNHRGAVTTWTWSTSSAYAAADRTAGEPWATTLPFPVHVVAQIQTQDVFAKTTLTTTFAYHDGYWDPADREFRGFRRVEQTDALTATTATPGRPGDGAAAGPAHAPLHRPRRFRPGRRREPAGQLELRHTRNRADHAHHDRRPAVRRRGVGRAGLGHVEQRRRHHDDRARGHIPSPGPAAPGGRRHRAARHHRR